MPSPSKLALLLATLCLPFAAAAAGGDDAISTDRPNVAESSQVIGKGRVQLETGLQWDRRRDETLHERTLTTPSLLRIGLSDSTELRIETDGRSVIHDADPASGLHTVTAGYADTALGLKWHLQDQQDNAPSLGVLLHADLPSGSRALRGHGVRPSLRLSAEWELANGLSLGLMPGVALGSDDDGARYGYGILAAAMGKEFSERLHGFVELAAPQIAPASHGGTQVLADTGLTYLISKDVQADAMVVRGLNRRTPELSLAFGLSFRL
ncbi:transporter [Massilia aerilata]|uniref:Transporter n=1 Tax=Massilia aerilata TaxID=453817 RepID=A0ABW0S1M8_9BURK